MILPIAMLAFLVSHMLFILSYSEERKRLVYLAIVSSLGSLILLEYAVATSGLP